MSWILPLPQLGGSDRTSIQSFLSGPGLVSPPVSVFKMIFNQIMNSGAGEVSTLPKMEHATAQLLEYPSSGSVRLRQCKGIENRKHLVVKRVWTRSDTSGRTLVRSSLEYGTNREAYCFVCRSSLFLIRQSV